MKCLRGSEIQSHLCYTALFEEIQGFFSINAAALVTQLRISAAGLQFNNSELCLCLRVIKQIYKEGVQMC